MLSVHLPRLTWPRANPGRGRFPRYTARRTGVRWGYRPKLQTTVVPIVAAGAVGCSRWQPGRSSDHLQGRNGNDLGLRLLIALQFCCSPAVRPPSFINSASSARTPPIPPNNSSSKPVCTPRPPFPCPAINPSTPRVDFAQHLTTGTLAPFVSSDPDITDGAILAQRGSRRDRRHTYTHCIHAHARTHWIQAKGEREQRAA